MERGITMAKKKRCTNLFVAVTALVTVVAPIPTFSEEVHAQSSVEVKKLPTKENVSLTYTFKIKLADKVDSATVTSDSVYILDIGGEKARVTLEVSEDQKTILIHAPESGYYPLMDYQLYVTEKVKSHKGVALKQKIRMDFVTEEDLFSITIDESPYSSYEQELQARLEEERLEQERLEQELLEQYIAEQQRLEEEELARLGEQEYLEEMVRNKAEQIIAEVIQPSMTEFEKVKAIHDYIVLHTAYDYDNYLNDTIPDSSYRIDGLLLKGTAVCAGYARTMEYLLEKVGVETLYVSGLGNGEPHAWNKVKVDGIWYNMDVTWDDPVPNRDGYVRYKYFLIPDDQLDNNHSWDDVPLPDATSTKYVFISDMNDPVLYNGYYYYSSYAENIQLYKIAVDGTNKIAIGTDRAEEIEVYNDWIYFNNYSKGGYLYKVKIDGTQMTRLNNQRSENLKIEQDTLYYTNEDGSQSFSLLLQ